jgi:two-component system OmpR family response regulator
VLVVDDEPEMRGLLVLSLASAGFRVHSARGGHEGLRRFRQVTPAAVVTDIRMPDLDGFEMCRRIREQCPTQTLPIILFSGLDRTPHTDAVVRVLGAIQLDKAAGPTAVINALIRLLGRKETGGRLAIASSRAQRDVAL